MTKTHDKSHSMIQSGTFTFSREDSWRISPGPPHFPFIPVSLEPILQKDTTSLTQLQPPLTVWKGSKTFTCGCLCDIFFLQIIDNEIFLLCTVKRYVSEHFNNFDLSKSDSRHWSFGEIFHQECLRVLFVWFLNV